MAASTFSLNPQPQASLWATYTSAPHRVMFLPGALQAVLAMAWWLLSLQGVLPATTIPAIHLHAWLMLFGLFPLFVFGFLFTAGPNWLSSPPIPRQTYLPSALLLSAGLLGVYAGLLWPQLQVWGLVVHTTGWGVALAALVANLRAAQVEDSLHARLAVIAVGLGGLGDALFGVAIALDQLDWLATAIALVVWGMLVPIFLVACHRMIPFFTSRVVSDYVMVRPYGLLWLLLAASLAHGALEAAGWPAVTWLADGPLAVITLWFAWRWGCFRHGWGVRLLAMLHISFLWAGLAFLLYALGSLALWLGWSWSAGHAPLHALGIGFFGSMLIGMASRVSLGHSGRRLEADGLTWALFWLLQAVGVVRMLPELTPVAWGWVNVAGLLWLGVLATWAARYAPFYWRPRADGRPG